MPWRRHARASVEETREPEQTPAPESEPARDGQRSQPDSAPKPDLAPDSLTAHVPHNPTKRAKKSGGHRPMAPARPTGQARAEQPKRRGTSARPIVFAVVALVVLSGIGVGVISSIGDEPAAEDPQAAPEAPAKDIDPRELAAKTANAFLEAIRGGDADALANMLDSAPTADIALLTDDVLADMLERHPMSDESVTAIGTADSWGKQLVDISYRLGDEAITYTIGVDTAPEDPDRGTVDVDLPNLTFDGGYGDMEVTVNGFTVPTGSGAIYAVVPGIYELATSADYLQLSGEPIIATSGFAYAYTHEHEPVLTDEGLAEFRSRVRASAEECLASTTFDAPCGLSVTGGLEGGSSLVDGTVERTISDDSWAEIDALEPTPASGDPFVMRDGFFSAEVVFIGDWTGPSGAGRDQIYGGPYLAGPSVDFADPDLPVTWGY